MSKRLQVLLDENEYKQIQKIASQKKLTVAEWVRQTLRAAQAREPHTEKNKKLQAIRKSIEFTYPTADIQQMLSEIETGYTSQ